MAFIFRKRLRLAKGLYLNFSKGGVSGSVSPVRGLTYGLGKRGVRRTVSVPGSGMRWSDNLTPKRARKKAEAAAPAARVWTAESIKASLKRKAIVLSCLFALAVGAYLSATAEKQSKAARAIEQVQAE